jgi:acetyl-CoA carboxylase biotin carboxyl carrier protein
MINIDDIEKIIQVVDKFNFSHFEFEQENSKIVIDKNQISESTNVESKINESKIEKNIEEKVKDCKEEIIEKKYIKAIFPGTFYGAKEQGEKAFVNINDDVQCDTVVGLIEAMKLFNEIEAGVDGTIIDVLVKDGDFVEYGQPLFEIRCK